MDINFLSATELFGSFIDILNALGIPLTLFGLYRDHHTQKKLRDDNISVYSINAIRSQPELIMGDSGRVGNGFNAAIYISREIDDAIKQSIDQKPCTIITGRAGSGKSRAVYQYLSSQENIFDKVVVIKRESLTCNMQQLQGFLRVHMGKNVKTLIYIDDFQNVKGINQDSGWELWESIIEDARKYEGKIVFVSRDKEDFEKGNVINIKPITRNSATHKQCTERFHSSYFSPIIGNYIERARVEDMLKKPGELLLISAHNFITHYFHRRGTQEDYLNKVYNLLCDRLATDLGKEEAENLKSQFNEALKELKGKGILGTNNNLTDELFVIDLSDFLYYKHYTYVENRIIASDAIPYICSLLTSDRSSLSYIKEKEQVKLLLSIDEYDTELYVRAITRATGQNTRRITKFVQLIFEENFIGHEDKISIDDMAKIVGLIASRTYYGWENIVNTYLKKYPSIKESNDLISEILRIATDERTSRADKKNAIDYIHNTLGISEENLRERATKDVRIALNYERAQEDIDATRIANVLSLLLGNLTKSNDEFHNAISSEKQEKIKDDIHYILRDIFAWARIVSIKVSSYQQLEKLETILQSHSRSLKILQDKIKAAPKTKTGIELFTFLSQPSLWSIARNIHKAYPMGYDKHYEKCINLLGPIVKKDSYNYIADKNGFAGFLLAKPLIGNKKVLRGALAELKTFHQVHRCIQQVLQLSVLDKGNTQVYIAWLYRLFSVIKTAEDFEKANAMLGNFLNSHPNISIEGKRKLYNNLLSNAPWEKAKTMVAEGKFLYYECDSYTISSLFKSAKNAFFILSKKIYLHCKLEDKIQSAIISGKILESIDSYAQLSRSRNLKWEGSSATSLKGIRDRLNQCIKQKDHVAENNPMLRDFIAEHGKAAQYIDALNNLILEIGNTETVATAADNAPITSDIARALDWSSLSVPEMKEKLIEIKQYFFEGVLNETGRTLTSDKMTHLIKRVVDMTKNTLRQNEKENWNFDGEVEGDVSRLLEDLVYEGKDGDPNMTLDAYIPVKLFYYTQVGEFLIYFINPDPKDRLLFGLNALRHLNECGNPISENKGEAHNSVNEKNIFEVLLADLSFDECAEMIDEIKKIAQVDIFNNVYTATSIVMLCNKLKGGLKINDDASKKILKARINLINQLISDETQLKITGNVLFFDADDAPRISTINTNLTKRNMKHPKEIFFPDFPKSIKINLPIASTNDQIRHAAWNMYADQECLYDIHPTALGLFLYRELENICASLSSVKTDSSDLVEYYREAMDLLHDEIYLNKTSSTNDTIKEITQTYPNLLQKKHLENNVKLLDSEPWIEFHELHKIHKSMPSLN